MDIEMIVKDEPMTHCECGHLLKDHRGIRAVGYENIDKFCIDENCDDNPFGNDFRHNPRQVCIPT